MTPKKTPQRMEEDEQRAIKLRAIIERSGLTIAAALKLFNSAPPPLFKPYSLSTWKAFIADPASTRRRPVSEPVLKRAREVLGPPPKKRSAPAAARAQKVDHER